MLSDLVFYISETILENLALQFISLKALLRIFLAKGLMILMGLFLAFRLCSYFEHRSPLFDCDTVRQFIVIFHCEELY